MQRTVEQTATLVAVLFKRANVKRARVSERTVRILGRRRSLRVAFLEGLRNALDDYGLHMIELDRGGFGLIPVSALEGAQTILAKHYIGDTLKELKQEADGNRQEEVFRKLKKELAADDEGDANEE